MSKSQAGALGALKKKELQANSGMTTPQNTAPTSTTASTPSKRKDTSTGQAPAKKRQRRSRNMLDPPSPPAPATGERPEYLPTHLPYLDLPAGDVPVPVILATNGRGTYEITNHQPLSGD